MKRFLSIVFCVFVIILGSNVYAFDPGPGNQNPVNPTPVNPTPVNPAPVPDDGTITVTGSGFRNFPNQSISILSYPTTMPMDANTINGRRGIDAEAFFDGIILRNGTFENAFGKNLPMTLVNAAGSPAVLSGGDHRLVVIIDREPKMMDPKMFDIGDNDLVAETTVEVDGNTTVRIRYNALNWTPFRNF